jgi:hypothetical protein
VNSAPQDQKPQILPRVKWIWHVGARTPAEAVRLIVVSGSVAIECTDGETLSKLLLIGAHVVTPAGRSAWGIYQ